MDAMLYKQTIENNEVIDLRITPVIKTLRLKSDQGVIAKGTVLQKNSDALHIPHAAYADLAMAGTVDGSNKAFTYAGAGFPGEISPRSVIVAHGDQILVDDGCGRLYGDGTGTVNYVTGAVAATFTTAPASESGAPVVAARGVPVGVAVRAADTSLGTSGAAKDDVVSTLVFGCVVRDRINVGGAAIVDADVDLLAKANVFALY
nr:hypothetical protein [uncultured Sphaerochaeta sp.]